MIFNEYIDYLFNKLQKGGLYISESFVLVIFCIFLSLMMPFRFIKRKIDSFKLKLWAKKTERRN